MPTSRRDFLKTLGLLSVGLGLNGCTAGESGADTGSGSGTRPTLGSIRRLDPRLDGIIPVGSLPEVLSDTHLWSEGPVWVPQLDAVLYSDIPNNAIYIWSETEGPRVWLQPSGYTGDDPRFGGAGANGLVLDNNGHLLLAQHGDRRVALFTGNLTDPTPSFETLVDRYDGRRFNSPNDLVVHSSGHIYFTDPPYGLPDGVDDAERELDFQGVYRISPDGELTLLEDGISRPNGILLSPDEQTLYVANSDRDQPMITAYPVLEDGGVGQGRLFHETWGDGMAVDERGNLYVAGPDEGVMILSPDGDHLGSIVTGRGTANCTFGEDGSTLFITASEYLLRIRLTARGA